MSDLKPTPESKYLMFSEASVDNFARGRFPSPDADLHMVRAQLSRQIAAALVNEHVEKEDRGLRTNYRMAVYVMTPDQLSEVIQQHIHAERGWVDQFAFGIPVMTLGRGT